ncbi:dTDP-4-dehydrorhamnose reductase [Cohnella sp. 56]|uniref:dTDP-4-dehydrorhamnose reductase n=1 Tax=Cohnella sp. 56 TaxID=3113722 RepID=UPI0030E96729
MTAERKKLIVTGANGQLGQELVRSKDERYDIIGLDRKGLDVTDLVQCKQALAEHKPSGIIHAAAYTAVDRAEAEPDEAYRVNALGTRNLAVAAREANVKLCLISTDYVFDGQGVQPYNEYDQTNPQSIYGKSKRAGEMLLQSICPTYFIVRTSWVYGKFGNNFVKTMLNLARDKNELQVVRDQVGSPTYTKDLAMFLFDLIQTEAYGIYHASNTGTCSWFEFAQAIFEESEIQVKLTPCTTAEFPRPAPRPLYSVLDHSAIRQSGFKDLPPWRSALRSFLSELEQ